MNKTSKISNLFSLNGKVVMVSGGAVNIGRAISLRLAEAGARLAVIYNSNYKEAISLGKELEAINVEHILLKADLRDEENIIDSVRKVIEHFGQIDILVNNAGVFSLSAQVNLDVSEWDKVFDVNVKGLFLLTRQVLKTMAGEGSIINIASINALHPGFGNTAHYDASKGAIVAYTKSLAAEVAPGGIRVNAVAPGLVDSENLRKFASELAESVEKRTPLHKLASAEDVANTVLFLSSKAATHITGEVIVVDGGYLLT
jgi:NAD(P)-dependent dehydrogenase (short-subunit alcohol dehydrogenase family)